MSNITLQLVGVVFGIMLGRILSDEDYGMMAMIAIFQLVAIALQNSGFTVAITNMKSPTHDDYNGSTSWLAAPCTSFCSYPLL